MNPYWSDDTVTIWHANALELPLPDESVDLIVTSPPYFGLRSYQDGGEHYAGQIGSEATPAEFVDALIAATREMVRVLKPSGSIFVNLGDRYAGGGGQWDKDERDRALTGQYRTSTGGKTYGMRPKSLILIPERYRIACVDQLGLIARAVIVWSKPNGLPESVTDRVRRSHEDWVHLVKQPRYYSAVDEIRETPIATTGAALTYSGRLALGEAPQPTRGLAAGANRAPNASTQFAPSALGKLPGSVWTIPTQPLRVPPELGIDHFAAFPMEWPRRIITGWSPRDVCTACGEGRRPVVLRGPQPPEPDRGGNRLPAGVAGNGTLGFRASKLSGQEWNAFRNANPDTITGYACACTPYTDHPGDRGDWSKGRGRSDGKRNHPERDENGNRPTGPKPPSREYHFDRWTPAPTTPGVILDPFAGTGTVGVVGRVLCRRTHLVDLSSDYCRLARWRVNDPGEIARAMQVEKPEPVIDGQVSIFDLEDGAA